MTKREELNRIAELMDEWDLSDDAEILSFREWLAQSHPEELKRVERLLGPERPPFDETGKRELGEVHALRKEWEAKTQHVAFYPGAFRDWLLENHPEELPLVERVLGKDP